ncbi:thiol reductant ABC exporter subunit CydC [Williamsia sp. MIQD14]|uniref:thiol reductant ABC exporter subunit CydC n=1 Tax=Williamsia sp. MIQD14 TaxID=3425703 RepID=UPI003DA00CA7
MRDPLLRSIRLLGVRPRPVARSLALGAGASISALALAALSAWLITRAWQMPPVLALSIAVTSVRALGISRAVLRYLERLATHDLALDAMATARSRMFRALATGDAAHPLSVKRSEIVGRAGDDVDEIGNALVRGLVPIGAAAVTGVTAIVVMTLVSPWAGLATAVAWLLVAVLAPWAAAAGTERSEADDRAARGELLDITATLLWHAPELAVAGRRDQLLADARAAAHRATAAADRGIRVQAWAAGVLPAATGAVAVIACLLAVGLSGQVDATTLGVLILLPLSAFEAAGGLLDAARQLQRSRGAARRVLALLDGTGVDTTADASPIAPVDRRAVMPSGADLVVDRLRWGHPATSARGPVDGWSSIAAGERIAVVGASGSGKTALLLTLAGLLAPRAGEVRVSGAATPAQVVRYFGEDAHLFATSVRENLLVSRGDADDAEITAALASVGLQGWIAGLPEGLDTVLDAGVDAVSAGQRRRLLLARVLVNTAPVVLLDEPCEHLDRDESDRLHRELLDPRSGLVDPRRTVIVATHTLPDDTAADRVIDLDRLIRCTGSDPGVTSAVHEEGGGLQLNDIWTREVTIS